MRFRGELLAVGSSCLMLFAAQLPAQQAAPGKAVLPKIEQATLTMPGNPAFHLKAEIAEGHDTEPMAHVEMYWVSPDKWRRTIQSDDFSQTLVMNGSKVSEQDSGDYMPLTFGTLLDAMLNPDVILQRHRAGDQLHTKANGDSSESGLLCLGRFQGRPLCTQQRYGLTEVVGIPAHSFYFASFEKFKKMRVARRITDSVGVGEFHTVVISELSELRDADENLFSIDQPTPPDQQMKTEFLSGADFMALGVEVHEIVWPQVLDGNTTGTASFYVSTDRTGNVREVLPVQTDNERSNDSARRQIMKWKLHPAMRDGNPVQAESLLTFALNTRAWGPTDLLSDAEVRSLATDTEQPVIPTGTPSGTSITMRVSIDADGYLVEVIPADGSPTMFSPCLKAVQQWHFKPFMQDGQPRPYRGEIKFVAP